MHRLHRRTLQRGRKDEEQRGAELLAKATLERLCDQGRKAVRVTARGDLELVRADKFLPIFLDRHCFTHTGQFILNDWRWSPAGSGPQLANQLSNDAGRRSRPRSNL